MSEQAAGSVSSSEADSLASSVDLFVPLSLSHALAKRRRVCISAGTEYLHQHVCVCPGTLEHECLSCTSMCVCPRTCEHECMSGRFLVSCFARPRSAGAAAAAGRRHLCPGRPACGLQPRHAEGECSHAGDHPVNAQGRAALRCVPGQGHTLSKRSSSLERSR